MQKTINNVVYTITDNSIFLRKSGLRQASARIKIGDIFIAEILSSHTKPLAWCRCRPMSPEYKSIYAQLRAYGIAEDDIMCLMAI
jgi:hypothetical protein